MQLALRPYVTSGIALVGASVIAMSPISPVTPDIHVPSISTSSVAVQLTASIDNPVDVFRPVFDQAGAAIQGFINTQAANPFPVLKQFIKNQVESATILGGVGRTAGEVLYVIATRMPAILQSAIAKSLAGDPATAFGDIVQGILTPAGALLVKMSHVYSVLQRPVAVFQELIAASFSRPQNFIIAGFTHGVPLIQQFIRSGQTIIDAVMTGNPVTILNAVQHGIADVASKAISFAAGMADQVRVIQNVLVRAFQARPRLLPNPAAVSAVAALAAAPETRAIAAGQDDAVVATPAPDAASGDSTATPVVDTTDPTTVVEAIDAESVVVSTPVTDATDTTAEVAAETEPAVAEDATTVKDGNKVVPGVVNTGVKGGGTALSKSIEAAQTPLKNLGAQVKSALDNVAHGFAKPAGSASGSADSTGAGSADSGGGEE
ncbi:hypothetical protein [Mycolicibacterium sp. 624]|uniref:hypothetical protein n=1 Tax=Mycolicibacterium sp. 624 TaxID=3156314 RepID=UPI00339163AA